MQVHTYNGETYRVKKGLSKREADSFCAKLQSARETRANGNGDSETYFEVDRMPEDYRAPSETPRKRGRPKKNAAVSLTGGNAVESVTAPVESTLYSEGFYRVPCATCGKGIPLTGKRGRAPKYHENCRPVS